MKQNLLTIAAVTAFFATATVVNAQQSESAIEKGERLAKEADANPKDWKKQYDVATFYVNPANGSPNYMRAEKFATRALEIAKSMTEKRDTILGKSFELVAGLASSQNKHEQAVAYYDQAIRAYVDELGYKNAAIPPRIAFLASYKWMLDGLNIYGYGDAEAVRSFREAFWLNRQLPEDQRAQGMDDALTVFALAHEMLIAEQMGLMQERMWQWTDSSNGKKYAILAFHDWTFEQPAGMMAHFMYDQSSKKQTSDYKHGLVLLDEQGNITERAHDKFEWNVNFNQNGNVYRLSDSTNLRLVSITPEKRQQLIKAFQDFQKKK